ncbi:MAG: type II toxin-antitoxin system RelE/ParE family toxin [Nitrospirota bacterium]|nr:type II toxin-antitoxin system RelE/ParE family toxin [Nitrospirota bacterium]
MHDYIARDSKTYATRFIKSLIKATTKLEIMPRCGRIVPELESYGFREVIFQNFRIVYRVIEGSEDVEILAVVHGAREIKSVLRQEWEL